MTPFFITGLPRSRTAWLANFFTVGKSFCWHDAMKSGMNAHAVVQQMLRAKTIYVGDSDSGLVFIARHIQRLLPDARWLLVRRDRGQAQQSFEKFFRESPYPGMPSDKKTITLAFDRCEEALSHTQQLLAPGTFIECEFEELASKLVLEEAWRFLTPGNPWDPLRCEMLQDVQLNIIPGRVTLWT